MIIGKDLRFTLRMIKRNPSYSVVMVIILAVGIAVNTVVFSFVNGLLLRPLPYPESDQLVSLTQSSSSQREMGISLPDFQDWSSATGVFVQMAAYDNSEATFSNGQISLRVEGAEVTSEIFSTLGVQPSLGRSFSKAEDKVRGSKVVVISQSLWQRLWNADRNIIGQRITMSGEPYAVIGVMPDAFSFPFKSEYWIPAGQVTDFADRENYELGAVARLKPGATIKQAQLEANAIAQRLAEQYPQTKSKLGAAVAPLRNLYVNRSVATGAVILQGAVAFVLLLACATLANLLLARGAARKKEFAIRRALGATGFQLTRQLVLENLVLSFLAGGLALLLVKWGKDWLVASLPAFHSVIRFDLDRRVLVFTALTSLLTGMLFSLIPAVVSTRVDLNHILKESGAQSVIGSLRSWPRSVLVATEVALAFILLAGAGLMIQGFLNLQSVDSGFQSEQVLSMTYVVPELGYEERERRRRLAEAIIEKISQHPEVEAVSGATRLPIASRSMPTAFMVEGIETIPNTPPPVANFNAVMPGYFHTMGIPLTEGREFSLRDGQGDGERVVIVSRTLAAQYWPNSSPVGKRIKIAQVGLQTTVADTNPWLRVAGVVGNVKDEGVETDSRLGIYVPYAQFPAWYVGLVIRSRKNSESLVGDVRNLVRQIDSAVPLTRVQTLDNVVADSLWRQRLFARALGIFAFIALALAATGIYGVISLAVKQRTREIGIRIALGASPRDVLRLIIAQGLNPTIIGVGIGLMGALALARVLSGLLFGISTTDLSTLAGTTVALTVIALGACYLPARRAAKVDPLVSLRHD